MMNDAQRKLAADNHNLIYKALQDYNLTADDYYDVAAIGLCKAALNYDESRNVKFSTFAVTCMHNELGAELRKQRSEMRSKFSTVSLDAPINSRCGENIATLGEVIPVEDTAEDTLIFNDAMDMDCLNDNEKRVAQLVLSGYSFAEISRNDGITREAVRQTYRRAQRKLTARYA